MEDAAQFLNSIDKKALLIIILLYISITLFSFLTLRFKPRSLYAGVLTIIVGGLFFIYPDYFLSKILPYMIAPSLLVGVLIGLFTLPEKVDDLWDIKFLTNKGTKIIRNIKRGVLIFGAAGSGKTESPIYVLLRHFAKKDFTGIVYDYKDGELTEICIPLFGDKLKIISMHKAYEDRRVNVFSSKYITDEKDINESVNVLISNLGTGKETSDFFQENASALLTAIVLKFHLDHREYCTLPHVIAFLLAVDFSENTGGKDYLGKEAIDSFSKLKKFLLSNKRVAIQAAPFVMGLASEKQTAAVLSTLANSLRKIAFPEAFWSLSGDTIDLNVNHPNNDTVLSIINEPKNDLFLTPIIATIIHTATKQMMVRDMKHSFLLLDEAPTIKLQNMAKIPATMRSFGVAVIYCAQDLVQGTVRYGRDKFREITANLSTQFFGKANDPDTARFYESYFELIEKDQKSISKKGGGIFETTNGTTTSKREVSKVRAYEFTKLKAGQFAFLSDGKNDMVKFNRLMIEREEIDNSLEVSKENLISNYENILRDIQSFVDHKIK
ncbi:type IV secretion system coupling TraD/TrwB family protein [Mariniflexile fucanivorans]|uniref:Type IV secretion system coupling TraD/TrwB family protein n=1 Tax=Mariniflexile fucanivorans TaxID=264023 RepID=A0A4R1R9S7_9FLAO|nr:type IV secretion system DNA-binding domain-containing protein [Mariniflexile fucanivorans]TCL62483.1 type IV secretion system coupling TraD/TrwB family protein [Mariniflexile fucanivorans]